ncbi:MAG: hypothetical protein PHV59_08225, partial [Victivallales bacterium]|nr:hypothetical protein [Victivallales bacterium]
PNDKHGLFLDWPSSAKSLGWFLCSISGGIVAMVLGLRWVYLAAAGMFLLLIPIIKFTTVYMRRNEREAEGAPEGCECLS